MPALKPGSHHPIALLAFASQSRAPTPLAAHLAKPLASNLFDKGVLNTSLRKKKCSDGDGESFELRAKPTAASSAARPLVQRSATVAKLMEKIRTPRVDEVSVAGADC